MKTNSITLRGVKPEDLSFLIDIENDMDNWFVSGTRNFFNEQTLREYAHSVHDIVTQGQYRFIIQNEDNLVGAIDLFEFDPINKRVGIGIMLKQEYRSNGFAYEGLSKVIQYCREHLMCSQVYCNIQEGNERSVTLFEKLGFNYQGRKKEWYQSTNGPVDELFYQLFF